MLVFLQIMDRRSGCWPISGQQITCQAVADAGSSLDIELAKWQSAESGGEWS